jgi:hypothetical protein
MCNILQFPTKANAALAVLNQVPSRGAKAALERAINKTLENENHVVTIEEEIMIFLFLEGFKIVSIEGNNGAS